MTVLVFQLLEFTQAYTCFLFGTLLKPLYQIAIAFCFEYEVYKYQCPIPSHFQVTMSKMSMLYMQCSRLLVCQIAYSMNFLIRMSNCCRLAFKLARPCLQGSDDLSCLFSIFTLLAWSQSSGFKIKNCQKKGTANNSSFLIFSDQSLSDFFSSSFETLKQVTCNLVV